MFTRKQYLDKECTHQEYYAQFVTDGIRRGVVHNIGYDAILNSEDKAMNDIPLAKWDRCGFLVRGIDIHTKMKNAEDALTAAGIVCILKEAARQVKEDTLSGKRRIVYYTNH